MLGPLSIRNDDARQLLDNPRHCTPITAHGLFRDGSPCARSFASARLFLRHPHYKRDFFPSGGPRGGDITKQFHLGDSQWLAGVIVAEDDPINGLAFHIVFTATCWCTYVKLIPGKDPKSRAAGVAA